MGERAPGVSTVRPAQKALGFPKSRRILKRSEYVLIQNTGFKISAECVLALVRLQADRTQPSRLGLTVSSKVGNAVVRSKIRRRCREVFRSRLDFPKGFDVVFIAKTVAATAEFAGFLRSLNTVESALKTRVRP